LLKVTDEATGPINPGFQIGGRKLSNILQIHMEYKEILIGCNVNGINLNKGKHISQYILSFFFQDSTRFSLCVFVTIQYKVVIV